MTLTDKDLAGIQTVVQHEVEPLKRDLSEVKKDLHSLATTVDNFVHIVRRHEDEWLVLRVQHEKIRNILVKKGIATEDELAVA
ncbi:MAG: hypothetical protein HY420_01655 [Candidatus Kerfeldbacteria bacterium]|nr:hypothetical protein [Candidatus Kerfeldbacteria bacterium]